MNEDLVYVTAHTKVEDVIKDFISYQKEQELPFNLFPRVQPHYAVKCNNYQLVLRVLAGLGLHFDCASRCEIEQVLSIGVDPSRIIFAHTFKPTSHVKYAAKKNVDLMTFDSKEELYKIKAYFPTARIVLRIKYDDPNAICVLGDKFGCNPYTEAEDLIKIVLEQKMTMIGVSFHIGFGSRNAAIFYDAIKAARYVFDAAARHGLVLELLDIGGGYPGKHNNLILTYARYINSALDEYFPDESVRVISEPGTYFLQSAYTLTCCIQSVKEKHNANKTISYNYYINDGVYGTMSTIMSHNVELFLGHLKLKKEKTYNSIVWGPTCNAIDKICDGVLLPKMNIGDYLVIDNTGSYSRVMSTSFNGFGEAMTYSIVNYENMLLLKDTGHFRDTEFVL